MVVRKYSIKFTLETTGFAVGVEVLLKRSRHLGPRHAEIGTVVPYKISLFTGVFGNVSLGLCRLFDSLGFLTWMLPLGPFGAGWR